MGDVFTIELSACRKVTKTIEAYARWQKFFRGRYAGRAGDIQSPEVVRVA